MSSRTPIRFTPYRGPLATPSTSPESSPTLSTPPTDISHCSTVPRPTLDIVILQHRDSTLSPPTRHQPRSHCRAFKVAKPGLSGSLAQLSVICENLIYTAYDLANTLTGIVAFCLLIWGLLEWSLYTSKLSQQPNPRLPISQFPLPSCVRALDSHVIPSLCEPRDEHAAVLHFLSEQIQHAKALSSLSMSLGSPLRAFFEVHRATIPRAIVRQASAESPHLAQEVNILANLTELLDTSLLDFTSGSFIGRSFALALDELGDLASETTVSHSSWTYGDHPDAHLHAIYWRTTSNLLLEYSSARPRARRLLHHVRALHQQLSPVISGQHAAESIVGNSNIWKGGFLRPPTIEDRMQAFVTGLEATLDNVNRLVAYLDWITEHLAQTTLGEILRLRHRIDLPSCLLSLQELFVQSSLPTPKKLCFCLNDYGVTRPSRLERVDIIVPGSPTVRAVR